MPVAGRSAHRSIYAFLHRPQQDTCDELCTGGIRSAIQHIIIHARRAGTTNNENGQKPLPDTAERCHEVAAAPAVQGEHLEGGLLLWHRSAVQHLTRRSAPFLYKKPDIIIGKKCVILPRDLPGKHIPAEPVHYSYQVGDPPLKRIYVTSRSVSILILCSGSAPPPSPQLTTACLGMTTLL